jgi:hypothetical protein
MDALVSHIHKLPICLNFSFVSLFLPFFLEDFECEPVEVTESLS